MLHAFYTLLQLLYYVRGITRLEKTYTIITDDKSIVYSHERIGISYFVNWISVYTDRLFALQIRVS